MAEVEKKPEEVAQTQTKTEVAEKPAGSSMGPVSLKSVWTEMKDAINKCPFTKPTSEILHWRDPIRSGLVFAIGNLFFFLITIGDYSIVTLVSYLFLILTGVSFGYNSYLKFKGTSENALAETLKQSDLGMTQEALADMVQSCHLTLEAFRKFVYQVFFARDVVLVAEVSGVVFLISQFGKLFSGTFFLYLTFLVSFVWPRVYEMKQKEIDAAVAQAVALISAKVGPILEKLPLPKPKSE